MKYRRFYKPLQSDPSYEATTSDGIKVEITNRYASGYDPRFGLVSKRQFYVYIDGEMVGKEPTLREAKRRAKAKLGDVI